MTTRQEWSADTARPLLASLDEPGNILMALQVVQDAFGYVPRDAIPLVAEATNTSRADVYGVLTFYSDLRQAPPPDVEVRICMGEACQAVGARELRAEARQLVDTQCDVTTVFCMGNCALGPTVVVNGRLIGRATPLLVGAAVHGARP